MNKHLGYLLSGEATPKKVHQRVTGIQSDSRRIEAGNAYFDLARSEEESQRYVNDAIKRGATSIIAQQDYTLNVKRGVEPSK